MKTRICLALLVGAFLATQSLVADEKEGAAKKFSATCPVSGQPADESHSLDYKGKKVYFCCENCPGAFEKNPAKYTAKANAQLLQTSQIVQVACPLTGRPMNPEATSKLSGITITFCCMNCKGKFDKASDIEKLSLCCADISKGFTTQTSCPVSGKAIKAEHVVEHKGKKVYFCCPNCPAAFEKDPAKFITKLPQFAEEKK